MLKLILLVTGTFFTSTAAFAQVTVGPGQTWSFEFTSLAFVGVVPLSSPIDGFGGASIFFTANPAYHEVYTLAMFQNSPSEPRVAGYLENYSTEGSGKVGGYGIWTDDLQGWIQLHVISAELVVTQVVFDVYRHPAGNPGLDHYQAAFALTAPVLGVTLSTNELGAKQFILQWPTNAVAYSLQASTSIDTSSWNLVNITPTVVGSRFSVAVDVDHSPRFFRLQNK